MPYTPHPSSGLSRRRLLGGSAALFGGLAASPLVAACSGGGSSAKPGSKEVDKGPWKAMTWEGKQEMEKWNLHISNFFKKYPDMKPSVDYGIDWDTYWTKLQTTVAGGASPDMAWMHDTRVHLFASQGLLEPLDDYLKEDVPQGWPDQFFPSQVQGFQYDGKQYGFPYDWATSGLYINLDWLEAAGVEVPTEDWTYDQLMSAAVKLTQHSGHSGKAWGVSLPTDSGFAHQVIKSYGGEYVTGNGNDLKTHFTEPGTVEGFQFLYDAIWKLHAMPNPDQIKAATGGTGDTVAFFSSGKVAMLHSLNDAAFAVDELVKGKFRWTVAPMPRGPKGRFQGVGGSAFSIPKGSPHPDLTYKFIKWTLSDPANLPVTAKMGSMYVSNTNYAKYAAPDKKVLDPAVYTHTFFDLGKANSDRPLYWPGYGRWDQSVYNKNMDNLWSNQTSDVAGTLARVQTETEPLLQSH